MDTLSQKLGRAPAAPEMVVSGPKSHQVRVAVMAAGAGGSSRVELTVSEETALVTIVAGIPVQETQLRWARKVGKVGRRESYPYCLLHTVVWEAGLNSPMQAKRS